MASTHLDFPLKLSDKAARALHGVPEEDCPQHPATVYVQIPFRHQHLLPGGRAYGCEPCFKAAMVAWDAQQTEHLRKRRAEREARQASVRDAKGHAAQIQERLRATLATTEAAMAEARSEFEQAKAAQAEAGSVVSAHMREVVEIEEQMRALRVAQQAAKVRLEAAKARVSCTISEVTLQQRLREAVLPLAPVVAELTDAYSGTTGSFRRKHIDKKLVIQAVKLLDEQGIPLPEGPEPSTPEDEPPG